RRRRGSECPRSSVPPCHRDGLAALAMTGKDVIARSGATKQSRPTLHGPCVKPGGRAMELFYAAGSPYARIVRVVLRETGLDRRVPEEEVALRDPNSGLLPFNPGGKVPTLQLDDGTILNESLLVLSYLDTQHGGRRLLPMAGSDGWRTLADTGRAIAFLDGISVWNRELRFGLKAPGVISIETARAERVADALERALGEGHYQGSPNGSIDVAQIVLGAAL